MRKTDIDTLKNVLSGSLLSGRGENQVTKVVTDSREAGAGDVFFALKGERNDGHDYLKQVLGNGTRALVVSDEAKTLKALEGFEEKDSCDVVLVEDTKRSLQRLSK